MKTSTYEWHRIHTSPKVRPLHERRNFREVSAEIHICRQISCQGTEM